MAAEDPSILESTSQKDKSPAGVCTEAVFNGRGSARPCGRRLGVERHGNVAVTVENQSVGMVKALRTPKAGGRASR